MKFAKHCEHGLISVEGLIDFENLKYFHRFPVMSVLLSFNTPPSYFLTLLLEVAKVAITAGLEYNEFLEPATALKIPPTNWGNQAVASAFHSTWGNLEKWPQPSLPKPDNCTWGRGNKALESFCKWTQNVSLATNCRLNKHDFVSFFSLLLKFLSNFFFEFSFINTALSETFVAQCWYRWSHTQSLTLLPPLIYFIHFILFNLSLKLNERQDISCNNLHKK